MHSQNRQWGASIVFSLILLALVGFAFTVGLRLVPIYIKAYTVQSILNEVAIEARATDTSSSGIWTSIERRLDINDIEGITRDNFTYKHDRDGTMIAIKFAERTRLIGNLDAIATFEPVETLNETPN